MNELVDVWDRAKSRFDDESIRPAHKAWISLTRPLGLVEDTALLAAPNNFAKEYLDTRLSPLIAKVLSEEYGRDIRVAVTVQPGAEEGVDGYGVDGYDADSAESRDDIGNREQRGTTGGRANGVRDNDSDDEPDHWVPARNRGVPSGGGDTDARLNPKYTFDTFVIGSSNRFTHAAAVAVAEAPARAYNPLFIYGDSGLGKTHLLHAICHYAQRLLPGLSTRYISSEEFTNDFINSVRDD